MTKLLVRSAEHFADEVEVVSRRPRCRYSNVAAQLAEAASLTGCCAGERSVERQGLHAW